MGTAISLRFLAGRYHATPWDRQVNEGEVEWPPSPWRLLRSFIAVWHRKVSPSGEGEALLESLIDRLAGDLPTYRLPRATRAHSRHYMPGYDGKTSLVFDAWVAVDREDSVTIHWSGVDLPEEERALLSRIVEGLGYLGRAEGWVEGKLLDPDEASGTETEGGRICLPAVQAGEEEATGEPIRLPVPMGRETYLRWREERIRKDGLDAKKLKKTEQRLLGTLPPRLLDVLRLDTADFRGVGWSDPPGCRFEIYRRPEGAFEADRSGRRGRTGGPGRRSAASAGNGPDATLPTTIRFVLGGKPLPRIEDALRIGEVMRVALIAHTDRRSRSSAEQDGAPEVREAVNLLSGHDLPRGTDHVLFLPEDADGDGKIDHILVHLAAGLPGPVLEGAGRIRQIWRDADERWTALPEAVGRLENFPHNALLAPSRVWESATPYLHPWFRKKGFGIEEQIVRECGLRGWGAPELERIDAVRINPRGGADEGGKELRPVHFHRFRSRDAYRAALRQPDRQGSLWRLTFPEAVPGPVTLGFGRTVGLGVFKRVGGQGG